MGLNKILTDDDRKKLSHRVDQMFKYCPDMMSRKITEANVQQAFALDTVLKYVDNDSKDEKILCVGCYEDTAYGTLGNLIASNYIVGIDPETDINVEEFHSDATRESFDIIFSTSVLEHVDDDVAFMSYFCDMLKPGGVGILTCDFNDSYRKGDPLPATVVKQFTRQDLGVTLLEVLERYGCSLVDEPDWSASPNFVYQGHLYSFATYVFKKEA